MRLFTTCPTSLVLLAVLVETVVAQRAVFLIRHAEKETDLQVLAGVDSDDQIPLTKAGMTRANSLTDVLKDAGIDVIYTSGAVRTQQTAKPLAESLKIESRMLESDAIEHFAERHRDQIVLIVGHSNTVPQMIDQLMKRPSGIKIRDDEFDALFVLVQKGDGTFALARTRY